MKWVRTRDEKQVRRFVNLAQFADLEIRREEGMVIVVAMLAGRPAGDTSSMLSFDGREALTIERALNRLTSRPTLDEPPILPIEQARQYGIGDMASELEEPPRYQDHG